MPVDYHLHTPFCRHAVGRPLEYVDAAKKAGLTEIGFADHNPMPEPFDDWRMAADQLPSYLDFVGEAGASGFPVRLGLECDFIPDYEYWIERLANETPWDYLIGSVHYIAPGWDVDNPKHLSRFVQYPVEMIWDLYWEQYIGCVGTGLFDFVAHPDLPKKFGYRPSGDLRRYYEPAIEALVRHNVGYEINTAGLRKEAREVYPAYGFIELAAKANVAVIINSDAHTPEEVGYQFNIARAIARKAGYSRTVRFAQRKRFEVDL
jgi:histidinol-phosphatase (PHP family)